MGSLDTKYANLFKALETLDRSIENYKRVSCSTEQEHELYNKQFDQTELATEIRDSAIKRFEYSLDLFWKYFRMYLEVVEKTKPEVHGPKSVVRASWSVGLFSENEAKAVLDMIESRNQTSHMYREEIAQRIVRGIPDYACLMKEIALRWPPKEND